MVIYADVLIFTNIIITYLILCGTKKVSGCNGSIFRIISASVFGGFTSLYIFAPKQNAVIEILIKLIFSIFITLIAFKKSNPKQIIRGIFCFFTVSFIYAGFMMAFFIIFKTDRILVNNSTVYLRISPVILVLSTAFSYGLLMFAERLLKREDSYAVKKRVIICKDSREEPFKCIVDTGNTLNDTLSGKNIVIISKNISEKLFGADLVESILSYKNTDGNIKNTPKGFRLVPYNTLNSSGLLPCASIDYIIINGKKYTNYLAGITDKNFDGDFDGIISPENWEENNDC